LVFLEEANARKVGPNHPVFLVPAEIVVLVFVGMAFCQALELFASVCACLARSFFVRGVPTKVATCCAYLPPSLAWAPQVLGIGPALVARAPLSGRLALFGFGASLAWAPKVLGIGPALVARAPLGGRLALIGFAKSLAGSPKHLGIGPALVARKPLGVRLALFGFAKSLAGSPKVLGMGPALIASAPEGFQLALLRFAKSPPWASRCWTL